MAEIAIDLSFNAKDAKAGIANFQKVSKSAFDRVKKSGVSAFDKIKSKSKSVFTALRKVGGGAATAFGAVWKKALLGFTAAFAIASIAVLKFVGASRELNREMANIATLIPESAARVVDLKKEVQLLAIETGKSSSDLADGLFQVISAFGDADDSMAKLSITAKAAAAGGATTAQSLTLLSAVTKGYGDTSATAQMKAADLAFMTNKLGQTTFPELAASMGRVVPLASTLNTSQEELFATFATLTGVTGKASEVSTQMAGVFQGLLKPTADMKNAMEALGIEDIGTTIATDGLVGTLRNLIGTTDGSSKSVSLLFGSVEALNAVLALSGSQADVFDEKLKAMGNSAGAMLEAYKASTEGIASFDFKVRQAKQAATFLSQSLGDLVTQNTFFITVMDKVKNLFLDGAIAIEKNKVAFMNLAKDGIVAVVRGIGFAVKVMKFFHNGWNGLKIIGHAVTVALADGLRIVFESLTLLLTPLNLIFMGLVKLGTIKVNPFETARKSLDDLQVASREGLGEIIDDTMETNARYEAIGRTIDGIVLGLQDIQTGQAGIAETAPVVAEQGLIGPQLPPGVDPLAGGEADIIAKHTAMTETIIANELSMGEASQARANIVGAANKALASEFMSALEAGKFSARALVGVIGQQVKAELVGIAARASVLGLFELAKGIGASALGLPTAGAHFASAKMFFLTAAQAGVGAVAAQAVFGSAGGGGGGGGGTTPSGGRSTDTLPSREREVPPLVINQTINSPLTDGNWDDATEALVEALNRGGNRAITINQEVISDVT